MEKIIKAIKDFDNYIVTSHINLEGDSLGSQLAMANLLKCLGKNFILLDNDKVPSRYHFLPNVNLVQNKLNAKAKGYEVAIVLDCPNLKRTGRVKQVVDKMKFVINIDHHVSNERFGDVNWVEKEASSVGEMIYKLYKGLDCRINKETALYLYISILTDTGSFNYNNTSSATHEIVSELLGYGIEPYNVSQSIYENKSLDEIRLLGKALSGLKLALGKRVAYMYISKKLFQKTRTRMTACENFVNFARSVKGVDVAAIFTEDIKKSGLFHVSFRSTKDVDVNKIASAFGGGGHKNASGCTVRGSFAKVKNRVLRKIDEELRAKRLTACR